MPEAIQTPREEAEITDVVEDIDEDDNVLLADNDEPSDEPTDDDPVTALEKKFEERFATLEALPKQWNDLRADVGRLRSIEAKLNQTSDTSKQEQLQQARDEQLAELFDLVATVVDGLDETAFVDTNARTKALSKAAERRQNAEREAFKREIRAEFEKTQPPAKEDTRQAEAPEWYTPAVAAFEALWMEDIAEAGWDARGEEWAPAWAALRPHFSNGGDVSEARRVMKAHMKKLTDERDAAEKRQKAKNNGSKSPTGATAGGKDGWRDSTKSNAERLADFERQFGRGVIG